jgi:hypothetical protein
VWTGGPVCGVDSGTSAWGPVLPGDMSRVSGVFGHSAGEGGVVCAVRCLCGVLPGSRCLGIAYDPWVPSTTCEPAKAWPSPSERQTARPTVQTTDSAQRSIFRRYATDEVSLADPAKAYNDGRATICVGLSGGSGGIVTQYISRGAQRRHARGSVRDALSEVERLRWTQAYASMNLVTTSTAPFGSLTGGFLLTAIGSTGALLTLTAITIAVVVASSATALRTGGQISAYA